MKTSALLAAAAVLAMTGQTWAWGNRGHMMVAAIAYDQLMPSTKKAVDALIRKNKYPINGTLDVSGTNAKKAAFMRAATAPDAIKSTSGFKNDGDDANAAGANASLNIGFSDKLMHRYWHYTDVAFLAAGASGQLPPTPGVTAQERIGVFRGTISDKSKSSALKAYDLIWLLHLVADVHQPLHDVTRVTTGHPEGDRGGNDVMLCLTSMNACKTKMHAYWDDLERIPVMLHSRHERRS